MSQTLVFRVDIGLMVREGERMNHWTLGVALGLLTFAGCTDDDARDAGDAGIDAGASDASIDASLGCMEADSAYFGALGSDPTLRQLGACTRDDECTLWRPSLVCPAIGLSASSCGAGTRADQVDAAYARRDEIASGLCPRIEPTCRIGVTCPPSGTAVVRCRNGTCAVDFSGSLSDGGL